MIRFGARAAPADGRRAPYDVLGIPDPGGSKFGSTLWKGMRLCPREHALRQLGVRRSSQRGKADEGLDVGWIFHFMLETYYRERMGGANHHVAVDRAYERARPFWEEPGYEDIVALLERMCVHYFDVASTDDFTVLGVEEELVHNEPGDPFTYSCRLDLFVHSKRLGGLWVVEHKSAKRITPDIKTGYLLDMQVLGQLWLAERIIDFDAYGEPLGGCLVNITSKDVNVQHERVHVIASKPHLAEFELSMRAWAEVGRTFKYLGWPKALGNCVGPAHYFQPCTYFDICHGRPDLTVDGIVESTLPLGFTLQQTR